MASLLEVYRKANSMMAMWRDDCRCGLCGGVADESDHVFGRGTKNSLLLEHWILRMSLCRGCHYKKHHGVGFDRVAQAVLLKKLNTKFIALVKHEVCYFALNQDISLKMADDTDAALKFIDAWLVANG